MQYSKEGIALTKSFESCRLTAYQDIKGIWTIGFGHVGPEVVEGLTWTQDQADSQLVMDTLHATSVVNRFVTIGLSQPAFDAVVDFVFNVGSGNFEGSTMLKLLNAGNLEAAADEFQKWDHASGVVVAGLLRRRIAEEAEFNG
jgi:lysozyme